MIFCKIVVNFFERSRQTEKQTDRRTFYRKTHGRTNGVTDGWMDVRTEGRTDRRTAILANRKTDRLTLKVEKARDHFTCRD